MTNVLVIGSSGYIGSQLVLELVRREYTVGGIDVKRNKITTLIDSFWEYDLGKGNGPTIVSNIIEQDGDYDFIIHLAALVGYPACNKNPELAKRINTDLLEYMDNTNVPVLMINAGDSIFGRQTVLELFEDTIPNPSSVYGQTKLEGEKIALSYGASILRLASVYGLSPEMRWDNLIHDWFLTAWTQKEITIYDPLVIRNFVSINEVINQILYWIREIKEENFVISENEPYIRHCVDLTLSKLNIATKITEIFRLFSYPPINITQIEGSDPENRNYSLESVYGRETKSWLDFYESRGIMDAVIMKDTVAI